MDTSLQEIITFVTPVVLWSLPFPVILVTNELLDRHTDWPREYHRKFGHILSGIVIIASVAYLTQIQLVLFALVLIAGALFTNIVRFRSVHQVDRKSIGTTLFPVAFLLLVVLLYNSNPELVQYGIALLTIPDATAAIIGSQWGKPIAGWNKSILGSTVFFIAALAVTAVFSPVWWIVLVTAVVLTAIEFASQWGIDNLLLPLLGAGLLYWLPLFVI